MLFVPVCGEGWRSLRLAVVVWWRCTGFISSRFAHCCVAAEAACSRSNSSSTASSSSGSAADYGSSIQWGPQVAALRLARRYRGYALLVLVCGAIHQRYRTGFDARCSKVAQQYRRRIGDDDLSGVIHLLTTMITMYQVRHDNNVYLPSASHFIMFHFFYSKQYIYLYLY